MTEHSGKTELPPIYFCQAIPYNENLETDIYSGMPERFVMPQKIQGSSPQYLNSCSDQKLVRMTLDGCDEAFEFLVLRHRRKITATARRYFPRIEDAEDLAQDSFLHAYKNLRKLKPDVPFDRWLIRLTINTCLDRLRKEKRQPAEPVSQICPEEPDWLERQLFNQSEDRSKKFEDRIEAEALLKRVLPLISPKDQAVLHLLYGEGMKIEEAALILGWSKSNVRVRAFRARRTMKKALESILNTPRGEDKYER